MIKAESKVLADDSILDYWKRTSGMHTVEDWCKGYTDHPAGWGALLMIHGIPEVTGRLRAKVENFAIYAALFVSGSLATFLSPPSAFTQCGDHWHCHVLKRVFF